jgi:predicted glycoside hydrolase/deacetylase ChbG (UPF0249 family)
MFRPPYSAPRAALAIALWLGGVAPTSGEEPAPQTWAERLGYPAGKKVVILHCDDIGMCWEANQAGRAYLAAGDTQSAAIMAPCPWFDDFAAWYREHPEQDVGLHLDLTSEWERYRWGPVSNPKEVPGLVDPDGYLWKSALEVALKSNAREVEKEIRAQVEKALRRGIHPGHLDTHMGTLYARLDFTKAYLKVAQEYRIPAMVIEMTPEVFEKFKAQGYPLTEETVEAARAYRLPKLDDFCSAPAGKTYEEKRQKLFELVKSWKPGITEIIFHPSVETEGLKRITNSWQQRVWEARLFSDPEVKKFLADEGIIFTSWKEMMKRWEERQGKEAPASSK